MGGLGHHDRDRVAVDPRRAVSAGSTPILLESGIISQPIGFLATGDLAFPLAILVGILSAIPLTVVIFLGGLSSLPTEIFDAARMDGARRFALFRYLTLPLIRPFIEIAVVLNIIYAFNSFAIVWVLTQGGPANSTDILVTYLYKVAFQYGKLAEASAMSLVMFAFLLVCSIVYAVLGAAHAGSMRSSMKQFRRTLSCWARLGAASGPDPAALCRDVHHGTEAEQRDLCLPAPCPSPAHRLGQFRAACGARPTSARRSSTVC